MIVFLSRRKRVCLPVIHSDDSIFRFHFTLTKHEKLKRVDHGHLFTRDSTGTNLIQKNNMDHTRCNKVWRNDRINFWVTRKCIETLTFSPNTKKGEGKVCSLLEQLTEDLWISAALPSVVSTLRFSRWTQTLGYIPRQSRATTYKETIRLWLSKKFLYCASLVLISSLFKKL